MGSRKMEKVTIPPTGVGELSIHGYHSAPAELREEFKDLIWESLLNYPKDKLETRQHTVPFPGQKLVIAGSFLSAGDSQMAEELANYETCKAKFLQLKEIGMDTFIVYTGTDNWTIYPSKLVNNSGGKKPLATILKVSDELDMQIYLGVPFLGSHWMMRDQEKLAETIAASVARLQELVDLFGEHQSFAGWYIPYELCDAFVQQKPELVTFIRDLSRLCHKFTPEKPVMIAPYFRTTSTIEEFQNLWKEVLKKTEVQILAMQDSVGCNGPYWEMRLTEIGPYYAALYEICQELGVRLWTDLELFEQTNGAPLDYKQWSAVPAKGKRIIAQVEAQSEYVEKIVCFDFFHHLDPARGKEQAEEFAIYKEWLTEKPKR